MTYNKKFDSSKDELFNLLLKHSVKFGDFTLRSGKKSNFYVDCRPVILSSLGSSLISQVVLEHFSSRDYIVAMGVGGSYIAGAICCFQNNGIIHIRDEKKEHGTQKRVEFPYMINSVGGLKDFPNSKVIVVDDVLTTGSSIISCATALHEVKIIVDACVVLVDREEGGKEELNNRGIKVNSIFTKSDFVNGVETEH